MVGGARAKLCVLRPKSVASSNPFRVLDEDTRAEMEFLAHSDGLTIQDVRGMRAQTTQRKAVRFCGSDRSHQESRTSRRTDASLEEWEKELRGNENRSTARSAPEFGTEDQFPAATSETSRRRRSGVGRMARPAPQRARKLANGVWSRESIDSVEVARDATARAHSVDSELDASLTTNTAVCPVGSTVPTTPMIGNEPLTEPNEIPDPPVSSHGSRQRRRRRSAKRWAKSRRCVAGCSCPSDSDGDEEPPHGIVDGDDEEGVPDTPTHLLSGL